MSYNTSNSNSYSTAGSISKHRSFRQENLICAGHHRAKEEFGEMRMWAPCFPGKHCYQLLQITRPHAALFTLVPITVNIHPSLLSDDLRTYSNSLDTPSFKISFHRQTAQSY